MELYQVCTAVNEKGSEIRDVIFTVKSVHQQKGCMHFNRYVWGRRHGSPHETGWWWWRIQTAKKIQKQKQEQKE